MRILLFSTVLYLLGISAVLYLRPALMFHSDGRWKEFGLHTEDGTIFPLWLFCIVWACVSYFISHMSFGDGGIVTNTAVVGAAAAAAPLSMHTNTFEGDEGGTDDENIVQPLPVPRARGTQKGGHVGGGGRSSKRKLPRGYYIYMGESEEEFDEGKAR
jgi:hypothetical protein